MADSKKGKDATNDQELTPPTSFEAADADTKEVTQKAPTIETWFERNFPWLSGVLQAFDRFLIGNPVFNLNAKIDTLNRARTMEDSPLRPDEKTVTKAQQELETALEEFISGNSGLRLTFDEEQRIQEMLSSKRELTSAEIKDLQLMRERIHCIKNICDTLEGLKKVPESTKSKIATVKKIGQYEELDATCAKIMKTEIEKQKPQIESLYNRLCIAGKAKHQEIIRRFCSENPIFLNKKEALLNACQDNINVKTPGAFANSYTNNREGFEQAIQAIAYKANGLPAPEPKLLNTSHKYQWTPVAAQQQSGHGTIPKLARQATKTLLESGVGQSVSDGKGAEPSTPLPFPPTTTIPHTSETAAQQKLLQDDAASQEGRQAFRGGYVVGSRDNLPPKIRNRNRVQGGRSTARF